MLSKELKLVRVESASMVSPAGLAAGASLDGTAPQPVSGFRGPTQRGLASKATAPRTSVYRPTARTTTPSTPWAGGTAATRWAIGTALSDIRQEQAETTTESWDTMQPATRAPRRSVLP